MNFPFLTEPHLVRHSKGRYVSPADTEVDVLQELYNSIHE
jgi:hypothetical protein